jgi:hypothetical protein
METDWVIPNANIAVGALTVNTDLLIMPGLMAS